MEERINWNTNKGFFFFIKILPDWIEGSTEALIGAEIAGGFLILTEIGSSSLQPI